MARKTLLPYKFSKRAQKDVDKATEWYNDQQWDLGLKFVDFLGQKIKVIRRTPEHFMFVSRNVQRALTKKFPYDIYFAQEQNSIVILRVRHKKQHPIKRFR